MYLHRGLRQLATHHINHNRKFTQAPHLLSRLSFHSLRPDFNLWFVSFQQRAFAQQPPRQGSDKSSSPQPTKAFEPKTFRPYNKKQGAKVSEERSEKGTKSKQNQKSNLKDSETREKKFRQPHPNERENNLKKERDYAKKESQAYQFTADGEMKMADAKPSFLNFKQGSSEILEREYIKVLFQNKEVRQYMLETYKIAGILFSDSKVRKFIQEMEVNKKYEPYLDKWRQKSKAEKNEIIDKDEKIRGHGILMRLMFRGRPYLELYTDFVNRYYKDIYDQTQKAINLTDLTSPQLWFPQTREMKRTFYYHMGPTNSGKTRTALERLMKAKSGIYCSPLRLLAWEVSETLSNYGIGCNLLTGQERQVSERFKHFSCTIEMTDFKNKFDVALIDEVQMIEDCERGFAWTNAILGVQAKEIHIIGEERALGLVDKIVTELGDKLYVCEYERLSSLHVEHRTIQSFDQLRPGDCIISFNRKDLFQLKMALNKFFRDKQNRENRNDKNQQKQLSQEEVNTTAIIYGALPPETKKNQAYMFNNRLNDIQFLVATDAIGMGLNLNISRIIFTTLKKVTKEGTTQISPHHLKQIAGRAGRYTEDGSVTAFKDFDLQTIRQVIGDSMKRKPAQDKGQKFYQETQSREGGYEQQTKFYQDKDLRKSYERVSEIAGVIDDEMSEGLVDPVLINLKQNDSQDEKPVLLNAVPIEVFKQKMLTENQTHIKRGCIFPPFEMIQQFADDVYLQDQKKHSLSFLLNQFEKLARLNELFFIKEYQDMTILADAIERVEGMSLQDKFYFCLAPLKLPMSFRSRKVKIDHFVQFAKMFHTVGRVTLPENFNISNQAFNKTSYGEGDLHFLEETHNILETYLWLGNKYTESFVEKDLCKVLIENVSTIIDNILVGKYKLDLFDSQTQEATEEANNSDHQSHKYE